MPKLVVTTNAYRAMQQAAAPRNLKTYESKIVGSSQGSILHEIEVDAEVYAGMVKLAVEMNCTVSEVIQRLVATRLLSSKE